MNIIHLLKRFTLISTLLAAGFTASAAIDAAVSFEGNVPRGFTAGDGSSLNISKEHWKDGTESMEWSWTQPSTLTYSDAGTLMKSFGSNGTGVMLWIYNTKATDADLHFSFMTFNGLVPWEFDFHMDFTGWRACWIKYIDMDGSHESKAIAKLVISTPEGMEEGRIWIDRLTFSEKKLHDQITPDQQIPGNNSHLSRANMWHWCRLWEWENYVSDIPATAISDEQHKELEAMKKRVQEVVTEGMSSPEYIAKTLVPRANAVWEKAGIKVENGSITGAPLLSNDECNQAKGELRLSDLETMVNGFASGYCTDGNQQLADKYFLVMDWAIDQGFAYGHGNGTNHHYGYSVRKIYDAAWLMRKEIEKRGKTAEYSKVLAYWSGLAEARRPYVYGRDEILDSWHTLNMPKIISALMLPSESSQYQAIKEYDRWLDGSVCLTAGTLGGIKPDGTTFHHGGFYPAYSTGAFSSVGVWCRITRGTSFGLKEEASKTLKLALLTLDRYTNLRDWSIGISGRHPMNKNNHIPDADANAIGWLAISGDLTGSGKKADPELGEAFLRLKGRDKEVSEVLRKEGITVGSNPEGFFVYNYAALGVLRRGNWMVTLKAFNTNVWGSEIYTNDNRFGRYQSYGTATIIGSGKPVGEAASGYRQDGWDWNRIPGATTIHLPFEILENPKPGTLMARNEDPFGGASSLEGRNGVLAFHLIEPDGKNFTAGATAWKSIFCFDNRLVFLGSGISNSNTTYPTETTLYQLALDDRAEAPEFDGEFLDAFPVSKNVKSERTVLSDTKGNYYVVKNGVVNISKQEQTSPNDQKKGMKKGDFVSVWIDHGIAPQNAGYEYSLTIQPSNKEINRMAKKDDYIVLRKDNTAHVVRDIPTGITGYVCFGEYEGQELVRRIPAGTIVMERKKEDGGIVISVCSPDLNLAERAYTVGVESRPVIKDITLDGSWNIAQAPVLPAPGVSSTGALTAANLTQGQHIDGPVASVEHKDGKTILRAVCINGQPTELKLQNKQ